MIDKLPSIPTKIQESIYEDAAKPSMKQIGSATEVITKTLNTLLIPLRALNDMTEIKYKKFISDFEAKASSIPKENVQSPELATVGPALTDLAFSLDEEEIREMYLNLLLKSIDNRTPNGNLRAFTQIIKQLSPFEAQLFKYLFFDTDTLHPYATISVKCMPSLRFSGQRIFGASYPTLVTNVRFASASEEMIDLALNNFLRLGLIKLQPNVLVTDENAYDYVEDSETYALASKLLHSTSQTGEEFNKIETKYSSFSLTSFGDSFCDICLF
ncbi:DUF4393 domain-containing protein [Hespellia stercorisuis]|uniref:DUF4393 domain-containing protein n=1 Tax=Hespellia stercorisuis DSM 15480 TaxID=1121950 RepID=A0A1M6VGF8_9FIRM|nr:DUF4393 domain-containing protein [Hespellia stercorisuis]SHK80572.1 protein of unknown function [Hespellia stercorisuis DSM 15480]